MKSKHPDHDLQVCLEQMSPDAKRRVIAFVESEIGMTIPEYREKQIKAAEAFITDVKANPGEYTNVKYNQIKSETVGQFDIPEELEKELERIRLFVGYRSTIVYKTDGTIEAHRDASYDEFLRNRVNPYQPKGTKTNT